MLYPYGRLSPMLGMSAAPSSALRHWRTLKRRLPAPRELITPVVFWALLALASVTGMLAPLEGRLFDLLVRLAAGPSPSAVALVYQGSGTASEALSTRLRAEGARAVVPLSPPLSGDCAPDVSAGVVRSLTVHDAEGAPCPFVEAAAAAGATVPQAARIAPDFSAATATSIPRVSDAAALSPGALRAAIDGRVALLAPGPEARVYVTPLHGADGPLEPAALQAFAVDSLLRSRAIVWAPAWTGLLVAVLTVLVLQLALQRARYRTALVATAVAALPVLGGAAAALHLAQRFVPVGAALVAIAAFALHLVLRRSRALAATLVDLDHRLTGLVQQPLSQGFDQQTDLAWEQVNRFVTQFFELRRSMMLELPPGATHMRPVVSAGCTPADIIEKRRDYRRAPYSDALVRELPTAPSRPFLPALDGGVDFIAPLIAADQLVGFWAFTVPDTTPARLDGLALEAGRYANEVAKMVLRAGSVQAPTGGTGRWPTFARLRTRLLDGAMQAREQLAAYRDVFAAVGHPIAVTDLLGRVQFANPAFEELAARTGQPLLAMSVPNMLEQLCGLSPAESKEVLRRTVLSARQATLPLQGEDVPAGHAFALRPILRRTPKTGDSAITPFDLLGMAVEITPDVRSAEAALRLGDAATQYAQRSWAVLDGVSRLLDDTSCPDAPRERITDLLERGLSDARRMLQQAESTGNGDGTLAPLELHELLQRLRHAAALAANDKRIEIRLPEHAAPPVTAVEAPLTRALGEAMALLVDDAAPGSILSIDCEVDGERVRVRLTNDGYGMPEWHIDEMMRAARSGAAAVDDSPLERLAHAATALDPEIGFELAPELGKGYTVQLTLPRAR
ncbi:PAS domain-containing protein [Cognatilysobacter bugurensis]|uniref:PAS domain-containing protein n=1 Tax=Cognatilysobacter bugurensis TaxID=543356 RepID=A0A918SZC1_9GAMM|nr:hypothetical protein [Lysobacter bugurensis]GHA80185.1 hypothetical protein GCM10007067_17350 [Lysobacter bugurensis]